MIDPSTRLRRAIHLDNVALVRRLLRQHPRLVHNADFDDKSNTSLHLAASLGFRAIAEVLVNVGHEEHEISRNTDHDTPLMLAARNGHVIVATYLARRFPRCVVFVNKAGQDVLAIAAQKPASAALIPVLLGIGTFGDDELGRDNTKNNADGDGDGEEGNSGDEHPSEPVPRLSVHSRDSDGNTALHHASASGSLKALRLLLAAGADPMARNNYDWTPLAYSQTVAAEVYFKNLVVEFDRKRVEGARHGEDKERQRAGGVRLVGAEEEGRAGVGNSDDEAIGDVLRRQWSPVDRRRPVTPGSNPTHEWVSPKDMARHRAKSGSSITAMHPERRSP